MDRVTVRFFNLSWCQEIAKVQAEKMWGSDKALTGELGEEDQKEKDKWNAKKYECMEILEECEKELKKIQEEEESWLW